MVKKRYMTQIIIPLQSFDFDPYNEVPFSTYSIIENITFLTYLNNISRNLDIIIRKDLNL